MWGALDGLAYRRFGRIEVRCSWLLDTRGAFQGAKKGSLYPHVI